MILCLFISSLCFCPNLLSPHCARTSPHSVHSLIIPSCLPVLTQCFCLLHPDVTLRLGFWREVQQRSDNESKKTVMAKANLGEFFQRQVESHRLDYFSHGHKAAPVVCSLTLKQLSTSAGKNMSSVFTNVHGVFQRVIN